ncbi:Allantoinase [uncultured archaeon]|nr:Allantoinase [uncultured archaeon]
MFIDSHWHARDLNEKAKETVGHSLAVGEAAGLDAIVAMPNTNPPLTTLEACEAYLKLADACKSRVQFYVLIGLTPNPEQVKLAVEATRKNPRIVGLKAYWGSSTGNLLIGKKEEQMKVFEVLVREGYKGVLVGHFEDEALIRKELYDSKNPKTWNTLCRSEKAEGSSVDNILDIAESAKATVTVRNEVREDGAVRIVKSLEEVGYVGKLHIAHVSTPEVVDAVANYEGPLKLTCGVTFHHVIFNDDMLQGPDGRWYKCNPPLRCEATRKALLDALLDGRINDVESDHASHDVESKNSVVPASGIASGTVWPYFFKFLRTKNVSPTIMTDVLFSNAVKLYNLQFEKRNFRPNLRKLEELQGFYPFDPFADFKRQYKPDF